MARKVIKKFESVFDIQEGGSHYKDRGIQPIQYCESNNLNMIESSVVKYVTRHQDKGGAEDIKKAIHLLQMRLELDYDVGSSIEFGKLA